MKNEQLANSDLFNGPSGLPTVRASHFGSDLDGINITQTSAEMNFEEPRIDKVRFMQKQQMQIFYRGRLIDRSIAMELIIVLLHKCVTVMETSEVFTVSNLNGERVFADCYNYLRNIV